MNTLSTGLHSFLVIVILVMVFITAKNALVGLAHTLLGKIVALLSIVFLGQYDLVSGIALTIFFIALLEYGKSGDEGYVEMNDDEETGPPNENPTPKRKTQNVKEGLFKLFPDSASLVDGENEGFTDNDDDQEGFTDNDDDQEGFTDNDDDQEGFTDNDDDQEGFTDNDDDQEGFTPDVNTIVPDLYCTKDGKLKNDTPWPASISYTGCNAPCQTGCRYAYAMSDSNEQITTQAILMPKDSNKMLPGASSLRK
jgi:hypothetical protein